MMKVKKKVKGQKLDLEGRQVHSIVGYSISCSVICCMLNILLAFTHTQICTLHRQYEYYGSVFVYWSYFNLFTSFEACCR